MSLNKEDKEALANEAKIRAFRRSLNLPQAPSFTSLEETVKVHCMNPISNAPSHAKGIKLITRNRDFPKHRGERRHVGPPKPGCVVESHNDGDHGLGEVGSSCIPPSVPLGRDVAGPSSLEGHNKQMCFSPLDLGSPSFL